MYRELVGYGIKPRIAAAVSSVFQGRRTASSDGLREAVAGYRTELCDKMASRNFDAKTKDGESEEEAGVSEDLETKLGYAVAKALGEDDEAALCAAMLAFTRVPRRRTDELEAAWFGGSR